LCHKLLSDLDIWLTIPVCENILNILEAMRFAAGTQDRLYLGKIDLQRDWGWAEDYVVAMYLMLQQERFSFRKRKAQALPT
jgi:hypothetical protein